jgi:hypothetical protein
MQTVSRRSIATYWNFTLANALANAKVMRYDKNCPVGFIKRLKITSAPPFVSW